MSKKTIKILTTIVTILLIISMASPMVFAAKTKIGEVNIDPTTKNTENVTNFGNKVIGMLQVVSTIIAVVIIIVLGIKYMMGSAEEKAEYKKTMIPYLVGAVLIFASATIVNVIYGVVTKM